MSERSDTQAAPREDRLRAIEQRQTRLLDELDRLNERVDQALTAWGVERRTAS